MKFYIALLCLLTCSATQASQVNFILTKEEVDLRLQASAKKIKDIQESLVNFRLTNKECDLHIQACIKSKKAAQESLMKVDEELCNYDLFEAIQKYILDHTLTMRRIKRILHNKPKSYTLNNDYGTPPLSFLFQHLDGKRHMKETEENILILLLLHGASIDHLDTSGNKVSSYIKSKHAFRVDQIIKEVNEEDHKLKEQQSKQLKDVITTHQPQIIPDVAQIIGDYATECNWYQLFQLLQRNIPEPKYVLPTRAMRHR